MPIIPIGRNLIKTYITHCKHSLQKCNKLSMIGLYEGYKIQIKQNHLYN